MSGNLFATILNSTFTLPPYLICKYYVLKDELHIF